MADIINIIAIILFAVCWILIIRKLILRKVSPVKTVKAEVIDKYKSGTVSNYPGTFKSEHYIVVFKTEREKLSFIVSENTYSNYKVKVKGKLKYKGTKILDFK